MFDFDSPALKEAVMSTLRDPDRERAIPLDQFFAQHRGDGKVVTPFDDALVTISSHSRDGDCGHEHLSRDIAAFCDLVDACQQSPHAEIREAPRRYMADAVNTLIPRVTSALNQGGAQQAQQYETNVLKKLHSDAVKLVKLLPDQRDALEHHKHLTEACLSLPGDHQLAAFTDAINASAGVAFSLPNYLSHPLSLASRQVPSLEEGIRAKAACELIKVARDKGTGALFGHVVDQIVGRWNENSHLAAIPDKAERIALFAEIMDAVAPSGRRYLGGYVPGVIDLGHKMLSHFSLGNQELGKKALERLANGEEVDFRSEVQDWQP